MQFYSSRWPLLFYPTGYPRVFQGSTPGVGVLTGVTYLTNYNVTSYVIFKQEYLVYQFRVLCPRTHALWRYVSGLAFLSLLSCGPAMDVRVHFRWWWCYYVIIYLSYVIVICEYYIGCDEVIIYLSYVIMICEYYIGCDDVIIYLSYVIVIKSVCYMSYVMVMWLCDWVVDYVKVSMCDILCCGSLEMWLCCCFMGYCLCERVMCYDMIKCLC